MRERVALRVVAVLIALQLLVLAGLFVYPRARYMVTHAGESHEEVLTGPGTSDWVNFNAEDYWAPLLRLRDNTDSGATLLFVSLLPEAFAYRYLHPRQLLFAFQKAEFERAVDTHSEGILYIVIRDSYFQSPYLDGLEYEDLGSGWRAAPWPPGEREEGGP